MQPFVLAIVGRPNVGKSTLFNRLVGRRLALVDDQPGVTRDRRFGDARLGDLRFQIVDTAGFEEGRSGSLQARMREQTEAAIEEADMVLMLTDARAGLLPEDEFFGRLLRKQENEARNAQLLAELASLYPVFKGVGVDPTGEWEGEASYLALGASKDASLALAGEWK